MLKLILLVVAFVVVAAPSVARQNQLAQIHVQTFGLLDEFSGEDYSLGRYYADRPNGYIRVQQNGHGGLLREAWFYFTDGAFYEDGTPIPGTADDVLRIDLTLDWDKQGRMFTFTMDELTISGSSIHFDNGELLDYPLTLPFDGPIGIVLGVGEMSFRQSDIDTFQQFDGVQSKELAVLGIVWDQAMDGTTVDFVQVPLPEPSMVLSLAAGVLLMVGFKGRRETDEHEST